MSNSKTARENYRIPQTCRTCRHCFESLLWGQSGLHYFCVIDYQKHKPLFLRAAMKLTDNFGSFVRYRRNWDRFAHGNKIEANGVCDQHEGRRQT